MFSIVINLLLGLLSLWVTLSPSRHSLDLYSVKLGRELIIHSKLISSNYRE